MEQAGIRSLCIFPTIPSSTTSTKRLTQQNSYLKNHLTLKTEPLKIQHLHDPTTTTTTMRSHLFIASAAAVALPRDTPPQGYNSTSPLSNAEFGMSMTIPGSNGTYANLSALWYLPYEMVLGAQLASEVPGTPAYIVNDEPKDSNGFDYVSLRLDEHGDPWALSAADIVRMKVSMECTITMLMYAVKGDLRGAKSPILAQVLSGPGAPRPREDSKWLVSTDGSIGHELKAGNNMFMACRNFHPRFQDETYVLTWGSAFNNGSLPEDCGFTSVRVNCQVPGSQYPLCSSG